MTTIFRAQAPARSGTIAWTKHPVSGVERGRLDAEVTVAGACQQVLFEVVDSGGNPIAGAQYRKVEPVHSFTTQGVTTNYANCQSLSRPAVGSGFRVRATPYRVPGAAGVLSNTFNSTAAPATIETVSLKNGSGSALGAGVRVFGMMFDVGELPASSGLVATLAGSPQTAQVDVKTRHHDGSAQHAVVAVSDSVLGAGVTRECVFSLGAPSVAAAVDLRAACLANTCTVQAVITAPAGAAGTVDFDPLSAIVAAIDAGTVDYWARGPLRTQARVTWNPRGTNARLRCLIDVTAWSTGGITVDLHWCNDAMMETVVWHGPITFTSNLIINGVTVDTTALPMVDAQRWHIKGASSGVASAVNCMLGDSFFVVVPLARWIRTALVGPMIDLDDSYFTAQLQGFDTAAQAADFDKPFSSNGLIYFMPAAGEGNGDRSPVLVHHAAFLQTGDVRAARFIRAHAHTCSAIPWHFWDRAHDCHVDSSHYWRLWMNTLDTTSTLTAPNRAGHNVALNITQSNPAQQWSPEHAHAPDPISIPYALTGERWMLDNLESLGAWSVDYWLGHRGGSYEYPTDYDIHANCIGLEKHQRTVINAFDEYAGPTEFRALAWSLRGVHNAAFLGPDGTHSKRWASELFAKNVRAMTLGIQKYESNWGELAGFFYSGLNWNISFTVDYWSHMMIIWCWRRAHPDIFRIWRWQTDRFYLQRFERTDRAWQQGTGTSTMRIAELNGNNRRVSDDSPILPPDSPWNYRFQTWADVWAFEIQQQCDWNIARGTFPPGAPDSFNNVICLIAASTTEGIKQVFADPARGNDAGIVARADAVYEKLRTNFPQYEYKLQPTNLPARIGFGFWRNNVWNYHVNLNEYFLGLIPGVPTVVVPSISAVPNGAPAGYVVCTLTGTTSPIVGAELRNQTVANTLAVSEFGVVTVANPAAIDFAVRQSFTFQARLQTDGGWGAWSNDITFAISDGRPVVATANLSISEHAPTATPPQPVNVGQVVGTLTITTPSTLTGSPSIEIQSQSVADAFDLGPVSGTVPTLTVPLRVLTPGAINAEGVPNPQIVNVRAQNENGWGQVGAITVNINNVVEPGDPVPKLLDALSVPNTTVLAAGGPKRLFANYSGPLARVWNSAGTPLDVSNASGGDDIDEAAMVAHFNGQQGYIAYYDQVTGQLLAPSSDTRRPLASNASGQILKSNGRVIARCVRAQLRNMIAPSTYTVGTSKLAYVGFLANLSGSASANARGISMLPADTLAEDWALFTNLVYVSGNYLGAKRWGTFIGVTPVPADGTAIVMSTEHTTTGMTVNINGTTVTDGLQADFPASMRLFIGGNNSTATSDHLDGDIGIFAILSDWDATDLATIRAGV